MAAKILPIVFVGTIIFLKPSENGRILAIMPTPSYSHQIVFNPLWLALNLRGHDITLLTTDPIKNVKSTNFRQVDWSFAYKLWHEKHNASDIISNFNTNFLKCLSQYVDLMTDIFTQEFEHPEVKEMLSNETEHFDLVIAEILNPGMIAFSRRFNCPFIGVSPMDAPNFVHEALDNPISPALYPDILSPFDDDMNFMERTISTFYYLGSRLFFKYYFYPKMDEIVKRYFGENSPKLEDMQCNASMVFLNINPIVHNVRPMMNNVLMIGGGSHLDKDVSLATDIRQFLDEAKNGAIYFSLGTNVKSRDLLETKKSIFLEAFSELPYRVLWKFEGNSTDHNLKNVLMKQWLPQQQILKHPNVKLFITQGGLQSLEEAIYSSVPIIAMPVFLDQYPNIRRVVRMGMGVQVDHDTLGKDELKNAINQVATNHTYKEAAMKLSVLLHDRPSTGITQAVWWTEYVLKHKGAKYLKHSKIPLYQYLLLDVLALFLCITVIFTMLLSLVLKCIMNGLKSKRRSKLIKLE